MSGQLSYMILNGDPDSYRELRDALAASGRVRLVQSGGAAEPDYEDVVRVNPDAVVIVLDGHLAQSLALIGRLCEGSPKTAIICASRDSSPDFILRSLRAGAREFLRLPIIEEELRTVLDRTAEFSSGLQGRTKKRGRLFTVFSSKGGCGTSFFAANFAAALHSQTVLVDLNLQSGDLDLYLGVEPRFTVLDVVKNRARIDDALLKSYLTPHSTRLSLLASPHEAGAVDDVKPAHVVDLLDVLRDRFDFVVTDQQHVFDPLTLTVLENADDVMLVSTLDIPSVRNTQRTLALFDRMGLPPHKIHLVINRVSKHLDLDLAQVRRLLNTDKLHVVHNDFKQVINSINLGKSLVETHQGSNITADIRQIVHDLVGPAPGSEERKGLFGSLFRRSDTSGSALELRATPDKV